MKKNLVILSAVAVLALALTGCNNKHENINDVKLEVYVNGEAYAGTMENNEIKISGEKFGLDGDYTLAELEDHGYNVSSTSFDNSITVSILTEESEDYVPPVTADTVYDQLISGTTRVNLNDVNNMKPDQYGKLRYSLAFAPEGTVIVRDDFEMKDFRTPDENVDNFNETLIDIYGNLYLQDGALNYNGGPWASASYNEEDDTFYVGVVSWGAIFQKYSTNIGTPTLARTLALNAMTYFGSDKMANSVYGILDEQYRFRKDNENPINDELAAKYGLTIEETSDPDDISQTIKLSNGKETWTVEYMLSNDSFLDSVHIRIPAGETATQPVVEGSGE